MKRPKFASYLALKEPGNEIAILNTVFTVKNWLDLVTSPDEKIFIYPDLANTRFRIHTHSKISTLESGLVCRMHLIRVDPGRIRKEKGADSKISGYEWTWP